MRRVALSLVVLAFLEPDPAWAQNVNVLRSTEEVQELNMKREPGDKEREIAIPLGVTAGLSDTEGDDTDAAALLGFQSWRKDRDFLAVFFSLGEAQAIEGPSENFGDFLVNPSTQGNSFFASASWFGRPFGKKKYFKELLVGPSGRAGLTKTTWAANLGSGAQSVDGFVGYLTLAVAVSSPTYSTEQGNEYQLGFELGPSFRWIGGDLGSNDEFLAAPEVLGFADSAFSGMEAVFYARLNSAQPFLRVTRFPDSGDLSGFSGTQATIGVSVLSAVFQGQRN